ncbi:MAG: TldD/PmbA family protein [Bacteroidales bacterium]|jgi:TldD protein|nr:TldD/PmbA family protein [Bacteroidales bacterium]
MNKAESMMAMFGVTKDDLRKLITVALSKGGDYADIYFEHSISNELNLRDSEVNGAGTHIDYGVGIRVINGEGTGYAYTEITTMKEMERAAGVAAAIATSGSGRAVPPEIVSPLFKERYKAEIPWEGISFSDRIPTLAELDSLVFQADSRVKKVLAKISDSNTKILFFNSDGLLAAEERPMASVAVTCIMQDEGKTENGSSSRSFRKGFEMLSKELVKEMAEEVVSRTAIQFEAGRPKGGEMPVVMGAGSSGILLHEAIGHAFEADFNRMGTSIFSDKLGKKVCSEEISVVDDGTIYANRGSVTFDDEGVESQKTYMVKDGVLNSYLHDRISAKYYNTNPTGNGRRESFRFMPLPRMRATYMESGKSKEEELISSVKNGLFVNNFSNGQVQIGAGDFTFFVKSGYLIENGKLTKPVKDINIIGNGPEALADIVGIADNSFIDNGTWTCGKEQYCAVSCGMPSVLVSKLTVGGVE